MTRTRTTRVRIARAAFSTALGLLTLALNTSCKIDTIVFSGDVVSEYKLPITVVPDSLRREVTFKSEGETIYGYVLRQPGSAPRLTMLYSHGKGGNLAQDDEWSRAEFLWKAGFDVLTYDYRGFGRSTGTSKDETTLESDARAAVAFLLTQPGVTISRIVSYGHSLGSVAAIWLATTSTGIRALVIEAGFSNGQAMAESADPLGIPVGWLMAQPMINTTRIATVTVPVLIMHGDADVQIPVSQGRDLFAAARDPKQLVIVPGAGHGEVQKTLGLSTLGALLRTVTNAATP